MIKKKIGLFIPCYIDQFYPQVGIATLNLLQKLGLDVHYPMKQTCCGQPLANSGAEQEAIPVYQNFVRNFSDFDY
ncbi:MAG: heterodisulfide reductase-related iron-sulfur binding cluster, partial [Bacteroidales bacterium]|nr:heterodisulfide reductase-related iron-sulfur binding cluster [Bacteroidales bacterium]